MNEASQLKANMKPWHSFVQKTDEDISMELCGENSNSLTWRKANFHNVVLTLQAAQMQFDRVVVCHKRCWHLGSTPHPEVHRISLGKQARKIIY